MVANRVYGVGTVALRYFNVFGERQDPLSGYAAVISKFIRIMLDGQPPTIFGDGQTSRDFTDIQNVVDATLAAAVEPAAAGHVMNIAVGSVRTLNEFVSTLQGLVDSELEPAYGPPRPGDVSESLAVLGYEPRLGFEEGLPEDDRVDRPAEGSR